MTDPRPIPFFRTHIAAEAVERVRAVLESGWVGEGEVVKQFEGALADTLGLANPVAVNSGTAALHLALVLSGVNAGDEVVIPPQTFIATGMVVLMQGAKPIFADIDPETGNLSASAFAGKISDRTKAVIPVHWGGLPCEMDAIAGVAAEHGVSVVEDAAHALGATYNGKPVGSLSRFTAFSFQAIKHLTTGDGGALCCAAPEDADRARVSRWFGIDRNRVTRSVVGDRVFEIEALGFKYHMNDVAAAMGLGNLSDFPARLERRRCIGARYRSEFGHVPGLTLPRLDDGCGHAYWFFNVIVEKRESFAMAMESRGIPVSVVDSRIDAHSVFGGMCGDLPGTDWFDAHQIAVPVHDGMTDDDVGRVVDAVRAGW